MAPVTAATPPRIGPATSPTAGIALTNTAKSPAVVEIAEASSYTQCHAAATPSGRHREAPFEKALVRGPHPHGANDGRTLWAVHHDHLQHVAGCTGTEHEVAGRVFSDPFHDQRISPSVVNFGGVDASASSRPRMSTRQQRPEREG